MAAWLSPEWIDEVAGAVAATPALADQAPLVLQTVVGDVAWHLRLGPGPATAVAGRAPDADVTVTQERAVARAVATGELHAQTAFLQGGFRVGGDLRALMSRQDVLVELDAALAPVRARTTFAAEED